METGYCTLASPVVALYVPTMCDQTFGRMIAWVITLNTGFLT